MTPLLLAAALSQPITVDCPDSVRAGESFSLTITSFDPSCSALSCSPPVTPGLGFMTSRALRSSSSVNGTTRTMCVLELVYIAREEGRQAIGPLDVWMGALGTARLPAESLVVFPAFPGSLQPRSLHSGDELWIEPSVRDSVIYPGCPFLADYYICSRVSVKDVETYWSAPLNGTSRMVDAPETLVWRLQSGVRRSRLLTLEVTAAAPPAVVLPVLTAQVSLAGLMFFGDGPTRTITCDSVRVEVTPFPPEGRPDCFAGLADSVDLAATLREGGGFDRMVVLRASGPGLPMLRDDPSLSADGAEVSLLRRFEDGDGVCWEYLVRPTDTGTVSVMPDSLAWFDRGEGRYRICHASGCSFRVDSIPGGCDSLVLADVGGGGTGFLGFLVPGILVIAAGAFLLRRAGSRRGAVSVDGSQDAEELLTAFEEELSRCLGAGRRHTGIDVLTELMDDRGLDSLLQRRTVRLWRDLEQAMAGGAVPLEDLRERCRQILREMPAPDRRS